VYSCEFVPCRERGNRATRGLDDRYARSETDRDRATTDERTTERDRDKQSDRERERGSDRGRERGDKDHTRSSGGVGDRERKKNRSRDHERTSQRGGDHRTGDQDKEREHTRDNKELEQDWEYTGRRNESRDRAGKDSKVSNDFSNDIIVTVFSSSANTLSLLLDIYKQYYVQ